MFTLHSVTDVTKNILKWIGIVAGSIFLILMLFRFGRFIKNTFFPSAPPPPTVSFGILPSIPFPKSDVQRTDFVYDKELGTVTGRLPIFPDRLNIFKMETYQTGLLSLEHAREKIAAIGFDTSGDHKASEQSLGNALFQWNYTDQGLTSTIVMNITTNDFSYITNFLTSSNISSTSAAPLEDNAKSSTENFLGGMGLLSKDIDTTQSQTEYLHRDGDTLTSADSPAAAQVTRVDMMQQAIDGKPFLKQTLPIYYPTAQQSVINFLLAPQSDFDSKVVQANYFHQAWTDTSATYPIKTAAQAYQDLQNGKGYISTYFGTTSIIRIHDISLGYYIGKEKRAFLIPIIVFSGNDGFVAYVPAVTDHWIQKSF